MDEIFIQRLIRKKKPNSRDRERSYDYHLKYIYICMYEVCIFSIVLKRFNGIVERFTSHEYISIEPLIKHERDIGKKLFHVPME